MGRGGIGESGGNTPPTCPTSKCNHGSSRQAPVEMVPTFGQHKLQPYMCSACVSEYACVYVCVCVCVCVCLHSKKDIVFLNYAMLISFAA